MNLVAALKKQGIQSIFNCEKADLQGMFEHPNIFIDDGIYKVQLEVRFTCFVGTASD